MPRRRPPAHLIGSGLIPQEYQNRYNEAQRAYSSAMANLGGSERSLFSDYGLRGAVDPVTGRATYEVDPTARFGKFQQWLGGLAGDISAARADAVARGLRGGGLSAQREGLARFAASQQQAEMFKTLQNSANDIFAQRAQALAERDREFTGAEGEALDWWNQYGPDDPSGAVEPPVTPLPGPPMGKNKAKAKLRHAANRQLARQLARRKRMKKSNPHRRRR